MSGTTPPDSDSAWLDQHQPRFDAIRGLLQQPDTLLDVGWEPPILAEQIITGRWDGDQYLAIGHPDEGSDGPEDVAGRTVQVARCSADQDEWPFEDDSVDTVLMGAILEHLFDPLYALEEARRVGSRLVLSTPNGLRLLRRARALRGTSLDDGFDAGGNIYHRHNHEYSWEEVEDLLLKAGWEIVNRKAPTLNRIGVAGAVYEVAAGQRPTWSDQIVVAAEPCEPVSGLPDIYRKAVTSRE